MFTVNAVNGSFSSVVNIEKKILNLIFFCTCTSHSTFMFIEIGWQDPSGNTF